MSSAVISTSAALSRPFVFEDEAAPQLRPTARDFVEGTHLIQARPSQPAHVSGNLVSSDRRLAHITPASRLEIRPAPEMVPSGIAALDTLTGGLPRGCITEICGPASSGRTTLLLAAVAAATRRGEFCAVVDASDALDPQSAADAGVELDRLLWVRCGDDPQKSRTKQNGRQEAGASSQSAFKFAATESQKSEHRLEQVLRTTDLLLESGGFGLIVLDLAGLPPQAARRIPLTTWFRFRRAVEHTPTMLLTIEQHPIAGSCSSLLLQLEAAKRRKNVVHGASHGGSVKHKQALEGRKTILDHGQPIIDREFIHPTHAQLLTGLKINAELIRSRLDRKPACSATFETKTAWAG